ncbi:hypothetical protein GDO81_029450 [Engystomops pustulosus]|uniref:Uncharacterized protein n=1 Tax=Engystomops pustulosus TaxID=76066 RepID=A0AAV6ZHW2_ENGPU|nr:hypothetical protein GDO81_029450 [Engystomops pustulosus]
MLNCKDRDTTLQYARRAGELRFENTSVSIFPDFSPELQRQRGSFVQVKRKLRERNIVYSMAYPARLRVIDGDQSIFFSTPAEADEWLARNRRSPRR